MSNTIRIGAALAIVILLLGGADYWFKELPHQRFLEQQNTEVAVSQATDDSGSQPASSSSASSASASGRLIVKRGTSTRKNGGIDVQVVLASLQLIAEPTNQESLLSLAAPNLSVQTVVLIQNNDRAALFSWIESGDVKTVFSSLKSALQEQFSSKLTDLVDETRTPENGPPVDALSFNDPAIATEDILFLRVRNRLYELHIAEESKDVIERLIETLSR